MFAAAPAPEFGADDDIHLDALLSPGRVGVGVAVVGADHAGFHSDEAIAAVPLLAFVGVVAVDLDTRSFGRFSAAVTTSRNSAVSLRTSRIDQVIGVAVLVGDRMVWAPLFEM